MSPWPLGRPLPDSVKKKLSQSHRGRRLSAKTRAAMSAAHQVSLILAADAAMRRPKGGRRG